MESLSSVSTKEIFDHLNKILDFPEFKNSQILSAFLKFVIQETLEDREHSLKEYTIGTEVLGKKVGYNPQADASVRIHAGRLRKALNHYYSTEGVDDEVFISIPKGTYVPGFSRKKTDHAVQFDASKIIYKPTIAVLPFHVPEDKHLVAFADGLCDQICTELGAFNELSVISYFSSRKMAEEELNLGDAGKLLDATFMLTGSIQSSDSQVRIRTQLIESSSKRQIWANTYERNKSELGGFALQDDIVRHVINQIGGSHGIIFREGAKANPLRQFRDIQVYDAVFWYYYLVKDLSEEKFQKGLGVMKNTVKLDPNYAMGWAVLGETFVAGYFYGFDCGLSDPLEEAIACGKKALQIDPFCQHTYQALCLAYLFQKRRKDCLQLADQWEKLNSKATGIAGGIGFCLIACGEFDRGFTLLCDSIQINPYYQWWFNAGLSFYHFAKAEFEDAFYWAEKIQGQSLIWELILKIASLVNLNEMGLAKREMEQLNNLVPESAKLEAIVSSFLQSESLVAGLKVALRKIK